MDLFDFLETIAQDISPGYLSTLLRIHRDEEFDGLFHIRQQEEEILFFLCYGEIKLIYTYANSRWQPVTSTEQDSLIQRIRGDLRIFQCPSVALRLIRLYIENINEIPARETDCSYEKIIPWIEDSFQKHGRGVVRFKGQGRQGLILTYPDARSTMDIAGWNELSCHTGQMVFNMLQNPRTSFYLAYHPLNFNSDAWREYLLTRAFQNFVQMLLLRFRTLAGQIMTGHVSEQLNVLCQRQRWKLQFREGVFFHEQFFKSPQEAQQAYQKLSAALLIYMGAVIGDALVRQSMRETQKRLSSEEQPLLTPLLEQVLQIKLPLEVA